MAIRDWSKFTQLLSKKLLDEADEDDLEVLAEEAPAQLKAKYLGYPGASADQIAAREQALGIRLPEDYRAFLLASNGFRGGIGGLPHGLCSLLPIEEIGWFKDKDAKIGRLQSYVERAASGEKMPDDFAVSPDDYARTLLVGESDGNECILLLPPREESDSWEVWTYHPEDGFFTGDTFTEFMESALEA